MKKIFVLIINLLTRNKTSPMKDFLIIGIPFLIFIALYLLSFEKKVRSSPLILGIIIFIISGYCGYLIGSAHEFSLSRVVLISIFLTGGVWRLYQFIKSVKMPESNAVN